MPIVFHSRPATGGPGIPPRVDPTEAKATVGTAYSVAASRPGLRLRPALSTEVYYPTIDRPQTPRPAIWAFHRWQKLLPR